ISPINVAGLTKSLAERGHPARVGAWGPTAQPSDQGHRRLLRPRRDRPRRRAAEQSNELAALHSITLSARSTIDDGTSKPIAFAACRLIANSNVVGCSIGTLLTFSPLKTLASCRASCRNICVRRGP